MNLNVKMQKLLVRSYINSNLPFINLVKDDSEDSYFYWEIIYEFNSYRISCICERAYFNIYIFSHNEHKDPNLFNTSEEYGKFTLKCKESLTMQRKEVALLNTDWFGCLLHQLSLFFSKDIEDYKITNPNFEIIDFNSIFEAIIKNYEEMIIKEKLEKKPWWRNILSKI